MNPNISWKIIKENLYESWNWCRLSQNPNISWNSIKNNLDEPWELEYLSENPNINIKFIENNIDNDWNWYKLSKNEFHKCKILQNIKQKIIERNWRIKLFYIRLKRNNMIHKILKRKIVNIDIIRLIFNYLI